VPAFAKAVSVLAPAKTNLALCVGPLRPDGFHEAVTVFQAVSLYDEVEVRRRSAGSGITLTVEGRDAEKVPTDDTNLAWRAAQLIADELDIEPDLDIRITKAIPVAGGMAGGSADAAATLLACDVLWRAGLTKERLDTLAAQLGSDVPFALFGGTAVGTGRGENLTSAMSRGVYHWVFALAEKGLSTPRVYAEFDRLQTGRDVPAPTVPAGVMEALLAGDPEKLGAALHNDLQAPAVSMRPELDMLLHVGRDAGALGGIVSGSGPTVAFLVGDEEAALDLSVSLAASGLCVDSVRAEGPVTGARLKD
jgi:4-diphosphocytidyl-2-C-methyl-D-erythritol kinase